MAFQIDIALKMIPEFNGNKENLHKFIACSDIVGASATTREQKETFLNVIKSKLCGSAYNLIKYKVFDSWEQLKIILQQQYLEKRTIAQIQAELINSKQYYNEDVLTFANRIERLTLDLTDACVASEGQAAYNTISNLNQKSALKAFVEGLKDPVRLIIKASRFTKLSDAISAACEEERVIKAKQYNNHFHDKSNKGNIRCYICNKPNHKASQCYSKKSSLNSAKSPDDRIKQEFNVRNVSATTCNYCKNVGHTINDCRKRQYNNSRRKNKEATANFNVGQGSSSLVTNVHKQSGNEHGLNASKGSAFQVREIRNAH